MPNRIVREAILSSEKVASLGWPEEVFYRRVMSIVDDYGRTEANPQLLRSRCYPLQTDNVRTADITRWMAACQKAGLILGYEVAGKRYLEVLNFGQQQRSASKYPHPPDPDIACDQLISDAHLGVSVVEDVSVSDALPSVVPRARGRPSKRCPEDFEVTAELRAWATEKVPGVDIDRETEAFRDWEFRDAKSDWPATWRRWMRKAAEDLQTRGGRTNSRPLDAKEAGRAAAAASIYGTGQPLDLSHGTREQEPFTIDV